MVSLHRRIGKLIRHSALTTSEDNIRSDVSAPGSFHLKSDRSLINILTTVLSWNFTATALALLFEATFQPEAPSAQIARHFIDSFIYSNCIGLLLGFAIFGFTPRLALL